ncbi:hypothetical protein JCM5353_004058 [Sporobolomyces roseus]
MSSTTPPTPVDSGECVVCGQVTTTRCSSCASHGTRWMYFCSKDHQKLIWFAHKRICGVNSNPFKWPLLTKEERLEVLKLIEVKHDYKGGKIWAVHPRLTLGLTLEAALTCIRGTALMVKMLLKGDEESEEARLWKQQTPGNEPFGLMQNMLNVWHTWDHVNPKYSWWSEMCHRLLIFIAINCHELKKGAPLSPEDPLSAYSRARIDDVVRNTVAKTHPEEALDMIDMLDRTFDGKD